ncbi:hypothetical protein [Nocardia salmonicida]|uniref:hypothetical protein n=1 Tax=Nocardia salmonicida TaxID=53431 RepID=UPI0007A39CCF|nr:hypothetical protein [Nocardia salmonicida]
MNDEDLAREQTVLHSDTAATVDAATPKPFDKAGRAMSYIPASPTSPSVPELLGTLDAMREAGWLTTAPATPTDDASGPRDQRLVNPRNAFHPTNEETR